jgi:hypothetical protein
MPHMPRPAPALLVCALCLSPLTAQEPKPDPVEKALAVQKAIAAARQHLTANEPARAVEVLEAQVSGADGNHTFLALLRDAYTAELKQLETDPNPDLLRVAQARRRLTLLGGGPAPTAAAPSAAPPAPEPPADDPLREAHALFKQGRYADAAPKFAAAVAKGAPVTQDEVAAWAYCRIKLASERAAAPDLDPATAAALEKDVREAIGLAPSNAELRRVGQAVVAALGPKAGAGPASPGLTPGEFRDWDVIDTPSFRVRFKGTREVAEAIAQAAEAQRKAIFERWSGPPAGAWGPRCEVVLHPSADAYARTAGKPAQATGHAVVRLTGGAVSERRVELRADDPGAVANALPRELTHVVLADLFPHTPPPKWAEEGMAVLASSPDEVGRYARTLPRCARDGELLPVAALLELKDFPAAERITGFYCASVTLVEYLVRQGGERNFTLFLRDCQRYGAAQALKRNYKIDGPAALEAGWKRAALDVARGQGQ